jgi:hypothetical protein
MVTRAVRAISGRRWLVAGLLLVAAACSDDARPILEPEPEPPAATPLPALDYAGSASCESCHKAAYNKWKGSGHPYKLVEIKNGVPPTFPYTQLPGPPPGSTWNDVLYVVGGYGYKARFVGNDGFFITAGGNNQWDLNTLAWSDYLKDQRSPYNCGSCHTTGYSPLGNQKGIAGLVGTWKEDGIGCEACHGPGNRHILSPKTESMVVDRSTDACAKCHNRNGVNMQEITAQSGFLMHRDALHSIRNTKGHKDFRCVDCHDPHQGSLFAAERNIKPTLMRCESCHQNERIALQIGPLGGKKANQSCTTCHMAPMTVSAVPTKRPWKGDMKSHLVRINTDPAAPQFYGTNNNRSYPYITLGFACLQCHETRTLQWAGENAMRIHKW